MTEEAAPSANPGWNRAQKGFVAVLVLAALSVVTVLGWSYLAVQSLRTQLEESNRTSAEFVDVTRQLGRLELAIAQADSLNDPEVEQAIALLERPFRVAQSRADDLTADPALRSDLAILRGQYDVFTLMRSTRPDAMEEAGAIIGLAEQTAKAAADETETIQRERILAQTKLVSGMATRTGLATAGVIMFNAMLLLMLRRRFRSAYADAYDTSLLRAAELEQSNKDLQAANETKRRFVSMVSHELRTPLTVIRGFGETLMRHGHGLEQEQRTQLATAIVRQARRQQRMIEDLLIVARHSDSVPEPERSAFEVLDMARLLVGDLQDDLRSKITLPDVGITAYADPRHVEQIIENLLTNAHKYGGDHIWISWWRKGDDRVVIAVSDDGRGVPAEFADTMFEEFSQADGGDMRASTGVGLGLSITRTLALANEGVVKYRDRDGGGAQFELTLPAAAAGALDRTRRASDGNAQAAPDGDAEQVPVMRRDDTRPGRRFDDRARAAVAPDVLVPDRRAGDRIAAEVAAEVVPEHDGSVTPAS